MNPNRIRVLIIALMIVFLAPIIYIGVGLSTFNTVEKNEILTIKQNQKTYQLIEIGGGATAGDSIQLLEDGKVVYSLETVIPVEIVNVHITDTIVIDFRNCRPQKDTIRSIVYP